MPCVCVCRNNPLAQIDVESLLESELLAGVSLGAEQFYHRLLLVVDECGVTEFSGRKLLARLYPRRQSVSERQVERWLNELGRRALIQSFLSDNRLFLQVTDGFVARKSDA